LRIREADLERHRRAEREASQDEGKPREEPFYLIEYGTDVVSFSAAFIMNPLASTNSAKIEPQRDQPVVLKCLRSVINDLHLHRPAVERVRVTNHRRGNRILPRHHEKGFETPRRPFNIQCLGQTHDTHYIPYAEVEE
jgi:hypothetical protein